ncbi:MAG: type II toxin-antitoxin system Phd/YefM family antitoxin [Bosea sp. (in: a-proteobacteria)]
MTIVNMHEAKSTLSKLVEAVASGEQREIILARHGKPVARIVALEASKPIALGLAAGRYAKFDHAAFQAMDEDVAREFDGEP